MAARIEPTGKYKDPGPCFYESKDVRYPASSPFRRRGHVKDSDKNARLSPLACRQRAGVPVAPQITARRWRCSVRWRWKEFRRASRSCRHGRRRHARAKRSVPRGFRADGRGGHRVRGSAAPRPRRLFHGFLELIEDRRVFEGRDVLGDFLALGDRPEQPAHDLA